MQNIPILKNPSKPIPSPGPELEKVMAVNNFVNTNQTQCPYPDCKSPDIVLLRSDVKKNGHNVRQKGSCNTCGRSFIAKYRLFDVEFCNPLSLEGDS
jgi:hypothetical protein